MVRLQSGKSPLQLHQEQRAPPAPVTRHPTVSPGENGSTSGGCSRPEVFPACSRATTATGRTSEYVGEAVRYDGGGLAITMGPKVCFPYRWERDKAYVGVYGGQSTTTGKFSQLHIRSRKETGRTIYRETQDRGGSAEPGSKGF